MSALLQKHVVLGISGGIAAYKSAEIIRRLRDQGAEVRVVMTAAAQQFITPLTLQALSGEPVHTDLLDPAAEAAMGHIELARWADVILVAPASADFLARVAVGRGDDLLTTLCLATKAPLVFAPAMNQQMWAAAATQANTALLLSRNVKLIGPAAGAQACGDVGLGRMVEPNDIVHQLPACLETSLLTGKKIVITAGPTREALDPVRFITNHSSGKMGYAIAEAACAAGAAVTLISGPVHLPTPDRVKRINVVSAQDMLNASLEAVKNADIFIATAAVADYRPAQVANQKIKKSGDELTIQLVKNPDIVATIAGLPNKPFTVGFAAETQDVLKYAEGKLINKKLDLICANDVSNAAIGFNSEENSLTLMWQGGSLQLPVASKQSIARSLIEKIAQLLI